MLLWANKYADYEFLFNTVYMLRKVNKFKNSLVDLFLQATWGNQFLLFLNLMLTNQSNTHRPRRKRSLFVCDPSRSDRYQRTRNVSSAA